MRNLVGMGLRFLGAVALLAGGPWSAAAALDLRYHVTCQDCDIRPHRNDELDAINAAGVMAGRSANHAVLYDHGVRTELGTLGGAGSVALDVNDLGMAVGSAAEPGRQWRAFLWQSGQMVDLGLLNSGTDDASSATSINDAGQIVGYYNSGYDHGFLATAVPEPSALVLLGIGAVGLLGYGAWRRSRPRA